MVSEVIGHGQPAEAADPRTEPAALRLWDRRDVFGPFAVAGALGVLAGGALAAAIAAPAPTRHGVWAVAYLVLVVGLGQIVLGAGQALLTATPPTARAVAATVALFNIASLAILAGVVTTHVVVFDIGSVLLIAALLLVIAGVRGSDRVGWSLLAYRVFVGLLIISVPIGAVATTLGPR